MLGVQVGYEEDIVKDLTRKIEDPPKKVKVEGCQSSCNLVT